MTIDRAAGWQQIGSGAQPQIANAGSCCLQRVGGKDHQKVSFVALDAIHWGASVFNGVLDSICVCRAKQNIIEEVKILNGT